MARPRSFEPETVLDAAAGEFRLHGFADTSTEQLCEAAGLRRSSLYNAFTSKEELFVQALERYTKVLMGRQAAVLTDPDLDGGTRLWRAVELVIDEERVARKHGHAAGCMILHSYMTPDVRSSDPRVQSILDRDLKHRLSLLTQAARTGRLDGSVRVEIAPEDAAMLVVTLISGLRVTAHAGVEPEQLVRVAKSGLASVLA